MNALLIILLVLSVANLLLLALLLRKSKDDSAVLTPFGLLRKDLERIERSVKEEFHLGRNENQQSFKDNREELNGTLNQVRFDVSRALTDFQQAFGKNIEQLNVWQRDKFEQMAKSQSALIESTEKRLEEMRQTVDEKLQKTLNERIGQSFELVGKQLESVQKGLGEMQHLAADVGGLKKVLTNVKTRGTFGEVQLETLLAQILSPGQFETQCALKPNSQERVDAVVKLPGQTDEIGELLLPIDSKFPVEDYQRLYDAYEHGEEVKTLRKIFESSVKSTAKSIADKYINPPVTTDFAIMFVPSEGIYAEILRSVELFESLRRDFRITIVGPTNLAAFLSSLQIGFRTLAIQKRSSEVWKVLGAVKTEFGKFGALLERVQKNIQDAGNNLDTLAGTRTKMMLSKLKSVEALPAAEAAVLLPEAEEVEEEEN